MLSSSLPRREGTRKCAKGGGEEIVAVTSLPKEGKGKKGRWARNDE